MQKSSKRKRGPKPAERRELSEALLQAIDAAPLTRVYLARVVGINRRFLTRDVSFPATPGVVRKLQALAAILGISSPAQVLR